DGLADGEHQHERENGKAEPSHARAGRLVQLAGVMLPFFRSSTYDLVELSSNVASRSALAPPLLIVTSISARSKRSSSSVSVPPPETTLPLPSTVRLFKVSVKSPCGVAIVIGPPFTLKPPPLWGVPVTEPVKVTMRLLFRSFAVTLNDAELESSDATMVPSNWKLPRSGSLNLQAASVM